VYCSCSHECWKPSTEKEIRQREKQCNARRPQPARTRLNGRLPAPEPLVFQLGVPVQLEWEDVHLLPRRHPELGVEFDRDLQKALARKRHVAARHVLGPLVVQKLVDRGPLGTRAKHWATGGSSTETGFGPPALAVPGTSRASAR
jgi:hypothetical protein